MVYQGRYLNKFKENQPSGEVHNCANIAQKTKDALIKIKMEIILMRSNAKLLNLSFLQKKCEATKIHVNMED